MLDRDPAMPKLAEITAPLNCNVELPPSWKDYVGKSGSAVPVAEQTRSFVRRYFCTAAALQCRQTFAALHRPEAWHRVYTKDMSRDGLSFFHSEQLFPRERIRIVLIDGTQRILDIICCRRIQARCFEVEARFVEGFHESAVASGQLPQ